MVAGRFSNAGGDFVKAELGGFDFEVGGFFVEWGAFFEEFGDGFLRVWGVEEWAVVVAGGAFENGFG